MYIYCDAALYEGNIKVLAQGKFQKQQKQNLQYFQSLTHTKFGAKLRCEVVVPAYMSGFIVLFFLS